MIEVDVDFNSVGRGGMVYAFPTAASSPVSAGTKVLAIDAEPAKAPTQDDLVADAGPGDFHLAYLAS